VIVPLPHALSTPSVYREFDARSTARTAAELEAFAAQVQDGGVPDELVVNDLQDAARALCPAIDAALQAVARAGADHALVSGSGPTVFGMFDEREAAEAAARSLAQTYPLTVRAEPVSADHGEPRPA
jgi:4-diphosphocytidyl-2-C-methyl-D-erythritol kinase